MSEEEIAAEGEGRRGACKGQVIMAEKSRMTLARLFAKQLILVMKKDHPFFEQLIGFEEAHALSDGLNNLLNSLSQGIVHD